MINNTQITKLHKAQYENIIKQNKELQQSQSPRRVSIGGYFLCGDFIVYRDAISYGLFLSPWKEGKKLVDYYLAKAKEIVK